jgi:hypothetical protein
MPPAPGVAELDAELDLASPSTDDMGGRKPSTEHVEHKAGQAISVAVEEGRIADYAEQRAARLSWAYTQDGLQQGDARKTADAIADVVRGEGLASPSRLPASIRAQTNGDAGKTSTEQPWPDLLVLGSDAEQNIRDRCHGVLQCLDDWKEVTRSIAIEE